MENRVRTLPSELMEKSTALTIEESSLLGAFTAIILDDVIEDIENDISVETVKFIQTLKSLIGKLDIDMDVAVKMMCQLESIDGEMPTQENVEELKDALTKAIILYK